MFNEQPLTQRSIICAVCMKKSTEHFPGAGWPGWGNINGVELNGKANPILCPTHLSKVMDFIDGLADKNKSIITEF